MSLDEINRLVAEQVMGWEVSFFENINTWEFISEDEIIDQHEFQPSTDIVSAWIVANKVKQMGFNIHITLGPVGNPCVCIEEPTSGYELADIDASTVPLAICEAALNAIGLEVK